MKEHPAAATFNVPALETIGLHAWHNDQHVLRGVDLRVEVGEVVALMGRTGSGHDALLQTIMGRTQRKGSIRIHGTESILHGADKVHQLGVGYCGAGRGILTGLSCEENLLLPSSGEETLGGGMSLAEIYELIPSLYPRRHLPCTRLSGGEQQMLAIARILRTGANLLLLDNISDGLAPVMVHSLTTMLEQLRGLGYTVLLIEQNLEFPGPLADRFYVMQNGLVIDQAASDSLAGKYDTFGVMLGH